MEVDNRSIAIIHDGEFHRTGNLEVVIPHNSSDAHSNFTILLATRFNMKRFMFSIFAIEQNMRRLIAQVNAVSSTSSKLPIPDAYTFTVDITDQTNEEEIELAIILCLMIDEMRGYRGDDDDDKEEFYNNS
ncbi:hypothetical protein I4U23_027036 [Adineta vaga]|nr:hypothetical protein I4U23_027036 [Adineta vaga]